MRTMPSTENVIAAAAYRSKADGDGLRLCVFVEGFEGLLPPVAGFLDPAEGQLDSPAGPVGVDEDLPGLDLGGQPVGAGEALRPQRVDEPVVGAVGQGHGLGLIGEG